MLPYDTPTQVLHKQSWVTTWPRQESLNHLLTPLTKKTDIKSVTTSKNNTHLKSVNILRQLSLLSLIVLIYGVFFLVLLTCRLVSRRIRVWGGGQLLQQVAHVVKLEDNKVHVKCSVQKYYLFFSRLAMSILWKSCYYLFLKCVCVSDCLRPPLLRCATIIL